MATKNVKSQIKSKVKSKAKSTAKKAAKSSTGKKLIAAAVVLVIIILIIAIIFISLKGLWGDIINTVKGYLGLDTTDGGTDNGGTDDGSTSSGGTGNGAGGGSTSVGRPQATDLLEMRVLDIGQGDCILLLFPDGQVMVMDIGSQFGTTSPWNVINGALTELEITTIDYLFLTHTDYDHIREAKKLIDNYDIKTFYFPKEVTGDTATWENAVKAAKAETYVDERGVTQSSVYNENVGYYEIVGATWIMKCYTYDEEDYPSGSSATTATMKNAVSPICLLEFADRTIVLTGDSNYTNEEYLLDTKGYFKDIDADVLKVAHHGSTTSTSQDFLNKVDCEYAIISCGVNNGYDHPTPELMARLESYVDLVPDDDFNGFEQIYRTDEDGTITVQINGKGGIKITSEKTESKNINTETEVEGEEISGAEEVALVVIGRRNYVVCGIAA